MYTGIIAVVGVASLLIFQKLYTGGATHVFPTQKGIFWSNLLYIDPVLFESFLDTNFYSVQLSSFTGIAYTFWIRTMVWINLFLLGFVLFRFLHFGFKRNWVGYTNWQVFVITTGLINLSIFLLLCFLSVTTSRYYAAPFDFMWSYISDPRYFVLMNITLVIIAGKWLFAHPQNFFTRQKWLRWIFLSVLAIEILHGVYYLGKHFTLDRRNFDYIVTHNRIINYIKKTIQENKITKTDVVVSEISNTYANYSVLLGGKGLVDSWKSNLNELHTEHPTKLLLILGPKQLPWYRSFLQKEGAHKVAEIGPYKLYSYYIEPDLPVSN
jgi:hypothetical protein